jgi:hypothetical protein
MRRSLLLALALMASLVLQPVPGPVASASGYKLPYPGGKTYLVSQGYNQGSHYGYGAYAWDFAMAYGDPVVASRAGTVRFTQASYGTGDCDSSYAGQANYVVIDHGDGYSSLYLHLKKGGVVVQPGQYVYQGQLIGYSDTSGWACGAHLHFQVQYTSDSWWSQSVPVTFDDVPGGTLKVGGWYTSGNYPLPTLELASSTSISPPQPVVGQQVNLSFRIRNGTGRTITLSQLVAYGTRPGGDWQVATGSKDLAADATWDVLLPVPSVRTMDWTDIGWWRLQGIRATLSDGSTVDVAPGDFTLARSFRVGPPEGSLIRGSNGRIYYIMQGKRRHVPDVETFDALRFRWGDVRVLSDEAVGSVPGGPAIPSVKGGWVGVYYPTTDFSGLPKMIRRDARIGFNWNLNAPSSVLPADGFSVRWYRLKYFREGKYTFGLLADDEARLYLDSVQLVAARAADGRSYWMGNIAEGYHLIGIDFRDLSDAARIQQWLVPGDGIPPAGSLAATPLPTTQVITLTLSLSATDNVTAPGDLLFRVGQGRPGGGISWSRWYSMTGSLPWKILNGPDGSRTVIYVQYRDASRNLSDRYSVTATLVRGVPVLRQPAEGAALSLPSSFAWSPVPDATRYEVQVEWLSADGWRAYRTYSTAGTSLELLSGLPPGQYRWRVRALVYGYWGAYSSRSTFSIN